MCLAGIQFFISIISTLPFDILIQKSYIYKDGTMFDTVSLNNHISFRFTTENAEVLAISHGRAESRYATICEERWTH